MQRNMTPISNPLSPKLEAMLQDMSTAQLTDLYQREAANPSGDLKLTMILGELKNRQKLASSVKEMPTSTVAQDVVAQSSPQPAMPMQPQPQAEPQQPVMSAASGGVVDLPIPDHMFQEKHMASGGIVAFGEGDLVEGMTQEDFLNLSPEQRARYIQALNDQRGLRKPFAAAYDLVSGPYNALAAGATGVANAIGVPRFGRALGIYDTDVTKVEVPRVGSGTATPFYDQVRTPLTEKDVLASLPRKTKETTGAGAMPVVMDPEARKALTAENAARVGIPSQLPTDKKSRTAPAAPAGPGLPSALPQGGLKTTSEDDLLAQTEALTKKFMGEAPEVADYGKAKDETMERLKEFGFDPDLIKKQSADLEKSREKLGAERATAINMRIIEAGLGIASGESQYGFVNLKGAIPAVKGLGEDINRISELDRNIDKEKRNLAVEQNKLSQGLASASEAKVEKSRERLDNFNKARGTLAGSVFNNLRSNEVEAAKATLQAQTAREGHAAQERVANIYSGSQGSKAYQQIVSLLNNKQNDDDDKIIAQGTNPAFASVPQKAAEIAAAKQRKAQRNATIRALMERLPADERTIIEASLSGVGGVGGKVITMAQVQQAAAKTGKTPEQVLADARNAGYTIQ